MDHYNFFERDERPGLLGWLPGWYSCQCSNCKESFTGAKRSYHCSDCAYDFTETLDYEQYWHKYYFTVVYNNL